MSTTRSRVVSAFAAAVVLGGSVACSTADDAADDGAGGGGAFPVTIEHALGETTIPSAPERIVTLGWASQDVVAALGVVPVGVTDFTWGNVDTYLPWFADEVEELGGDLPEIIETNDADEYNSEQILELEPDLIIAAHSGLTDVEYERLSTFAPTIGYAESTWRSDWREVTTTIGRAMGKTDEAEALVAASDKLIADAAADHPEFADVTFAYGWHLEEGGTDFNFYVDADPRVQLIQQLGLTLSPEVEQRGAGAEEFHFPVSLEEVDTVTADLFIGWATSPEDLTRTVENPALAQWGPIKAGAYWIEEDKGVAWAMSAPSVLSIPWGLDRITGALANVVSGRG